MKWMWRAKCRDADPEVFWPSTGEHGDKAQQICAICPVIDECRDYVLSLTGWTDPGGVWGGLTHQDRRQIRSG